VSAPVRWLSGLAGWLDRWLVIVVLAAAALGMGWPSPSRATVSHHGISVALVVLVGAVGLGLPAGAVRQARAAAGRVLAALAVGAFVLPILAYAASRIAPAGPLRLGVLAAGVAPSEVAAVALAALAGGQAAVAAAVLAGSTMVSVLAAGVQLQLLAGGAAFSTVGLIGSLTWIVAVPLVTGAVLGRVAARWQAAVVEQAATTIATLAVLVLIWLVAGQAHLDARYLRAGLALVIFLAGSTLAGALVSIGLPRHRAVSLLLPVAMRDFAIAAGIATAAFGPAASAPLGLYGILVLLFGAAASRLVKPRDNLRPASHGSRRPARHALPLLPALKDEHMNSL